jgi:pimeloyl-ACP methyl ester carboxylesterase
MGYIWGKETMPFAQNDDVEIFYETTGKGYPIILQHGLFGSYESWYGKAKEVNYVKALQDKYQVILIDARGHGRSGKPHAPEKYAMKNMVRDVTTVLDKLSIEKAVFWGYSMGGRIGLAAAKYAPERFSAYVIGGFGISEKDTKEEYQDNRQLLEKGIENMIRRMEEWRGFKLKDWEYKRWRNMDSEALIAYMSYYENIGMVDYLPKVTAPFLFYAGSEDTVPHHDAIASAELIPNAEFVSLPGLNHLGASTGTKAALPQVLNFLEKVTQ